MINKMDNYKIKCDNCFKEIKKFEFRYELDKRFICRECFQQYKSGNLFETGQMKSRINELIRLENEFLRYIE